MIEDRYVKRWSASKKREVVTELIKLITAGMSVESLERISEVAIEENRKDAKSIEQAIKNFRSH